MPKRKTLVEDVMIRTVATIRQDADVHELEKRLLEDRIHGMPVVDDEGMLVGVVSQTDLIAWHYFSGIDGSSYFSSQDVFVRSEDSQQLRLTDIRTARVAEVMSPIVYCICPDQPIALAAARMVTRQIHRLVVVDDAGKVMGIVAASDLLATLPGVEEAMEEAEIEKSLADSSPLLTPRDEAAGV
jgi:CBS-domain-containing membrane protein